MAWLKRKAHNGPWEIWKWSLKTWQKSYNPSCKDYITYGSPSATRAVSKLEEASIMIKMPTGWLKSKINASHCTLDDKIKDGDFKG